MRFVKFSAVVILVLSLTGCGLFKGKKDCDCPSWGSQHLRQPAQTELALTDE